MMQPNMMFVVDTTKLNINDLLAANNRPGAIIRTTDVGALKVFTCSDDMIGLAAGLISEEE
jgi:hypothetical protein